MFCCGFKARLRAGSYCVVWPGFFLVQDQVLGLGPPGFPRVRVRLSPGLGPGPPPLKGPTHCLLYLFDFSLFTGFVISRGSSLCLF